MSVHGILISHTGGPEVLTYTEVPLPPVEPGRAKVRVAAAGVNFIDIYQREGIYPRPLPFVPGSEGAGTVVEIGPGVTEVQVGDRVAWESWPGSYADEVVGPADRLIPVPAGVSDDQAAAFALQGLTAHYLATSSYAIKPGDTVLIHAGAGGVGLLLTQVAKILGARVLTTVSGPEKAALSRAAGADEVLDYDGFDTATRELTGGRGVAAVYDGVGRDTFDRSLASVARRGTVVLFGAASGPVPPVDPQRLAAAGSVFLTRPTLAHFVSDAAELRARSADVLGWIGDGRLDLRIGGRYRLADAAKAQQDLAARRTTGKLLLIP